MQNTVPLYIYGLRAEISKCLGNRDHALRWASQFLSYSSLPDTINCTYVALSCIFQTLLHLICDLHRNGITAVVGFVLDIFFEAKQYDLLQLQIKVLLRMSNVFPALLAYCERYVEKITGFAAETKRKRQTRVSNLEKMMQKGIGSSQQVVTESVPNRGNDLHDTL